MQHNTKIGGPLRFPQKPQVPPFQKICQKTFTDVISAEGESNAASESNSTIVDSKPESCVSGGDTPARLCKSSFNTTAPMYGVSLTSGKPVTIVQIFPDLLQQVVYETCE